MSQSIEIKGLKELLSSMTRYPVELAKTVAVTMSASLNTLWGNVPPYPPPPSDSAYRRTGTLGRSLGSGMGGGASSGEPSIYKVRQLGEGNYEGTFGTNLDYASYVIGDTQQASVHQGRWWTMRKIAERAAEKINRLWQMAGDKLVQFLEGKQK